MTYVWHSSLHVVDVARSLTDAGFDARSYLIWAKERLVMGRGHYHWQHEPCFYAVREGRTASWAGGRDQATVWTIPSVRPDSPDDGETVHGTQKPVECMARPIRNHEGDAYDPFLGSGTTVIAAEKLNRACHGMEIEPRYVDVIRRRWAEFVEGAGCDWEAATPAV